MTASSRLIARPRQWLLGALVLGGLTLAGTAQAHVFGSISLSLPPLTMVVGNTPRAAVAYTTPVYATSPAYPAPVYSTPVYPSPVYASPVYPGSYATTVYTEPAYAGVVYAPAPVVYANYGAQPYPVPVRGMHEHERHGWPMHGGNWGWREGHRHGHGFD